jgi:hypothetical protein
MEVVSSPRGYGQLGSSGDQRPLLMNIVTHDQDIIIFKGFSRVMSFNLGVGEFDLIKVKTVLQNYLHVTRLGGSGDSACVCSFTF